MANPKTCKFTKSHEWVEFIDETTANIGLSFYAQAHLGDLVFVNLPQVGDTVEAGGVALDVESVKAVSDVYSGVSGVIGAVNEELADEPAKINEAPYDAWIIRVDNITETADLMDFEAYEAFCIEEG